MPDLAPYHEIIYWKWCQVCHQVLEGDNVFFFSLGFFIFGLSKSWEAHELEGKRAWMHVKVKAHRTNKNTKGATYTFHCDFKGL
jgi:hypothetical protein